MLESTVARSTKEFAKKLLEAHARTYMQFYVNLDVTSIGSSVTSLTRTQIGITLKHMNNKFHWALVEGIPSCWQSVHCMQLAMDAAIRSSSSQ
jgi:hypothetical protein